MVGYSSSPDVNVTNVIARSDKSLCVTWVSHSRSVYKKRLLLPPLCKKQSILKLVRWKYSELFTPSPYKARWIDRVSVKLHRLFIEVYFKLVVVVTYLKHCEGHVLHRGRIALKENSAILPVGGLGLILSWGGGGYARRGWGKGRMTHKFENREALAAWLTLWWRS